jgi:hypothetical protein
MRRQFTITALLVGFAAAPALAQAPAKDKPITVPFTLLPSRHMMLEVKVNDKGPYKLIFDTGAPINLINTTLAKDAGLIKKRGGGGGLFGGLLGGVNQLDVDKLEVGGVIAEKLPAIVMDHPTVRAISDAFEDEYGRIDGIVGFPFFGRYATTVDYQKKELVLKPTDFKPGDYMQDLTRNLMSAGDKSNAPKVVGAAGLWGFVVEKAKDDDAGTVVKEVFANTPAATAGLKAGDRLLTLDGRWTDTVADAYLAASLVKPGRTVAVVVKRDGKELSFKVTPTKGY